MTQNTPDPKNSPSDGAVSGDVSPAPVDVTDGMRQTAITVATMSGALLGVMVTLAYTPLSYLTGAMSHIGFGVCALMAIFFLGSIFFGLGATARQKVSVGPGNGFDRQAKWALLGLLAATAVVVFSVIGTRQNASQQTETVARLESALETANTRISTLESTLVRVEGELADALNELLRAKTQVEQLRLQAAQPDTEQAD